MGCFLTKLYEENKMKAVIEYSCYKCNLISCSKKYDDIIFKFYTKFKNYYRFKFGIEESNLFTIVLCDDIDKDIFKHKKYEIKLIHNSHSQNRKILLNGLIYNQQDATKHAAKITQENMNYFWILETNTYIKTHPSLLVMSGNNMYDDLVYVFESLLNTFLEKKGNITLHAASCLINDEGVVICGKSGSGKTTLLFDLIKHNNAIFQANDRVSIFQSANNSYYICGIPIPVNVPQKVLTEIPSWKSSEIVKNADPNDKIRFLVEEIPLLFKETVNTDIRLKKILITDYNANNNVTLKQLDPMSALKALDILSPMDYCHPNWLEVYISDRDSATVNNTMNQWLENIEVYLLSGKNPYESFSRI